MNPSITLKHAPAEPITLEFDILDRERTWLKYMVMLPWMTPQRMVGFVHPAAEPYINGTPFVLHGAFVYYGSVGMQQVAEGRMQVAEGPKILLPYDLISPVDVQVHTCPSVIWVRDQSDHFQSLFNSLLMQQVNPPRIELAPGPLLRP